MKNGEIKIIYDTGYVDNDPTVHPLKEIPLGDVENRSQIIKDYMENCSAPLFKEPTGAMKYPYIVPGGSYMDLWDWDSFFVSCAAPDKSIPYAKGSVMNFLDGIIETTGRPPKKISPDGHRDTYSFPYPLQAQYAYIVAKRVGDFDWIKPYWNNLKRMRKWFDDKTKSYRGYYLWMSMYGNGIDNNPAVYGRRNATSAGVDLASWHYRDIMAMYQLAKLFEPAVAADYLKQAEELKAQIQMEYWDIIDKSFYNIDCSEDYAEKTLQEITWHTFLKFRNISTVFPLWAGIASEEQAKCIRDALMNEDEFLSVAGVRSHSKIDPIYNNTLTVDPSNWQGPVWGLSSYLAAYGLARYGYKEEALEICRRMDNTFANDILTNGCVHEYYHGDSGQPLFRPHFISWNMLARCVEDDLIKGNDCTTYELLEI